MSPPVDAVVILLDLGPLADADLVAECARVGAGAVRSGTEFPGVVSLPPGGGVLEDVLLGPDPVGELAAALRTRPPETLAVGGDSVRAVLAGLAAGTQVLVRASGDRRADVQAVARAAALARLAGRAPLTGAELGPWLVDPGEPVR